MVRLLVLATLLAFARPSEGLSCTVASDGIDDTFQLVLKDEMLEVPVVAKVSVISVSDQGIPYLEGIEPFIGRVETVVVNGLKGVRTGATLNVAWIPDQCLKGKPQIGRPYYVAGKVLDGHLWGTWTQNTPRMTKALNEWLWSEVEKKLQSEVEQDD